MFRENNKSKKRFTINAIQNGIFYMLFLLLPFSIIPMPWDWATRGTSLLILIISIVIVSLELLKFIWEGKISIFKNSVDLGILFILLASIISTVLSVNPGLSFWGIDMNLGSGLISLVAVILVSYAMRSFIDTFGEIVKVLIYFSIGISIINIFSLMSFCNIDFLQYLPAYKSVFQYGLPWTLSAHILLLLNGVVSITTFGVLVWNRKRNIVGFLMNISVLILSLLTILVFSLNQGFSIILTLFLSLLILVFLTWRYIRFKKPEEKFIRLLIAIPLVIVTILFALLKIPVIRENILASFTLLTQVSLGNDISWEIVFLGVSRRFTRALVGFGKDTFVILYNMFKPATMEVLAFNNANFYYGSSEVITQFAEGGVLWLGAWILSGYLIVKELLSQIRSLKRSESTGRTILILTLGLSALFMYISSFFCHLGILEELIFFIVISLWVVALNLGKGKSSEKFTIKIWVMGTNVKKLKKQSHTTRNINILMTILVGTMALVLIGFWCRTLISNIYIASAEQYISTESIRLEEDNPSQEERDNFLSEVLNRYSKAEMFGEKNPLINRKLALLSLGKISLYSEQYTSSKDQNEQEELLDRIVMYKKEVVNQVQKAIDKDPQIYSNWETASSVYMGLLSIGFKDYDKEALNALSNALDLNPTNYELYYSAAQVYMVQEDTDDALAMLIKVLEINPTHIPSLLMAGEINKGLGEKEIYISYLKAAKAIMEEHDQTETDVYQEVIRGIKQAEEVSEE